MVPIITTPRLMAVGGGALAELPSMLQRLGLANPLIVTDPFLERSGHLRMPERPEVGIAVLGLSESIHDHELHLGDGQRRPGHRTRPGGPASGGGQQRGDDQSLHLEDTTRFTRNS